jgi:putative transposase
VLLMEPGSPDPGLPMSDNLHSHLAHVRPFAKQPIVFLTVCTKDGQRVLACSEMHAALTETWCKANDLHGWAVGRYVIMPDHVHLFARAGIEAKAMAVWVKSWKSFSSRRAGLTGLVESSLWQADYFDRYLRNGESYSEKWSYVVDNPVRAGLVKRTGDWLYQGEIEQLTF